jgi:dTDP-4-dehydrorhamnose reductase
MRILVTGAKGQLGSEIKFLSDKYANTEFTFGSSHDLDISNQNAVEAFFSANRFDFVINCAAYTAVDKAEIESDKAFSVNALAPGYLASACTKYNTKFIHISTDFVFDGSSSIPLKEDNATNPLSVYGKSKLEGEKSVLSNNENAIVIRTGWLYSSYGNNFAKTILRLCKERESLNIIFDQTGTPTYARNLADAILEIIHRGDWKPGLYHFGNEGVASWYDFAIAIRDIAKLKTTIFPIETSQYPTPAKRPAYSVLNKTKIKHEFGISIPYWRDSLEKCMQLIISNQ